MLLLCLVCCVSVLPVYFACCLIAEVSGFVVLVLIVCRMGLLFGLWIFRFSCCFAFGVCWLLHFGLVLPLVGVVSVDVFVVLLLCIVFSLF